MKSIKIKDLAIMAILEALLIVFSKITFPIGPIPLTLQTLAVFLISLILGVKKSMIVFELYMLMGLIGIPVFSTGGGWSYVLQPSFGFIIGFFFASIVIGLSSKSNKFYTKYIMSTIGLLIIDLFGVIYMFIIMNYYLDLDKNISYILSVGVLPFFVKDFACMILSCVIYSRLQYILYPELKPSYDFNIIEDNKKIGFQDPISKA